MQQGSCLPVEDLRKPSPCLKWWAVKDFLMLCICLAISTVTSFLTSLLSALASVPAAASLTLLPAPGVLVRSPAWSACRNRSLMHSGALAVSSRSCLPQCLGISGLERFMCDMQWK